MEDSPDDDCLVDGFAATVGAVQVALNMNSGAASSSSSHAMSHIASPPPNHVKEEGQPTFSACSNVNCITDDDEVMEVENPNKRVVMTENDGDDECCIVGSSVNVTNPLLCTHYFTFHKPQPAQPCGMCHCLVCDDIFANCLDYDAHIHLKPEDKDQIAKLKDRFSAPQNTIDDMMYALRGVYPEATTLLRNPLLSTLQMSPVQKQGLQFMYDIETKGLDMTDIMLQHSHGYTDYTPRVHSGYLALAMGGGKTICTAAIIGARRMPTLIIVPNSKSEEWKSELKRFLPDPSLKIDTVYTRHRAHYLSNQYDVLIVPYQTNIRCFAGWASRVICDEAHIKTMDGQVTDVISKASHTWFLSGTPIGSSNLKLSCARILSQLVGNGVLPLDPSMSKIDQIDQSTIAKIKRWMFVRAKEQKCLWPNGKYDNMIIIPPVNLCRYVYDLSPCEKELYRLATCLDQDAFTRPDEPHRMINPCRSKDFRKAALLRQWDEFDTLRSSTLLSSRGFKKFTPYGGIDPSLQLNIFCTFFQRLYMCLEECKRTTPALLTRIKDKVEAKLEENSSYRVVLVSDMDATFSFFQEIDEEHRRTGKGLSVIFSRASSKISDRKRTQNVLADFNSSSTRVMLVDFAAVTAGHNFQMAHEMILVDTVSAVNSTVYQQAITRIQRPYGATVDAIHVTMFIPGSTFLQPVFCGPSSKTFLESIGSFAQSEIDYESPEQKDEPWAHDLHAVYPERWETLFAVHTRNHGNIACITFPAGIQDYYSMKFGGPMDGIECLRVNMENSHVNFFRRCYPRLHYYMEFQPGIENAKLRHAISIPSNIVALDVNGAQVPFTPPMRRMYYKMSLCNLSLHARIYDDAGNAKPFDVTDLHVEDYLHLQGIDAKPKLLLGRFYSTRHSFNIDFDDKCSQIPTKSHQIMDIKHLPTNYMDTHHRPDSIMGYKPSITVNLQHDRISFTTNDEMDSIARLMGVDPPEGWSLGDELFFCVDGKTITYRASSEGTYSYFLPLTHPGPDRIRADFKASKEYTIIRLQMGFEKQHKRVRQWDVLEVDDRTVRASSKRIKFKLQGTSHTSDEDYWQCPPSEYESASSRANMWLW